MEENPLLRASSFTVAPTGSGGNHATEIHDSGGGILATCDAAGNISDPSNVVLLRAPVRSDVTRNSVTVEMDITGAEGDAIAIARVVKYGIGPRSKKATVAVTDAQGTEIARLEARDKKGEDLAVASGDTEYASIGVAEVKAGFMKKNRIYSVALPSAIPDSTRLPILALAIRYDALLDAVASGVMRIEMKR